MVIAKVLEELEPVSLSEIEDAKLMNRIDTKFLANVAKLPELLRRAGSDYRVLEIEDERLKSYYTLYFDTPDLDMYNDHRRGKKARQKVRIRRYEGAEPLDFLEVKDKDNKGNTRKKRRLLAEGQKMEDLAEFIAEKSNYTAERLEKVIENRFYRITLVKKDMSERVTIDTGIRFRCLCGGEEKGVEQLMVVEWKRKRLAAASPMKKILKELGMRETGFSKYCIGMAMTHPSLRRNRLKPRIRLAGKLCEQGQA